MAKTEEERLKERIDELNEEVAYLFRSANTPTQFPFDGRVDAIRRQIERSDGVRTERPETKKLLDKLDELDCLHERLREERFGDWMD